MSNKSKIKKINENEDMVDEIMEDFTMGQVEVEEEVTENEVDDTEEDIEEDTELEEGSEESVSNNSGEKPNFFVSLAAIISDGVIIAVLTYVLLYVVDFVLRNTAGLMVVEKIQMSFLIYVVVSLLYVSILESALGATVGKTVCKIKVSRK